MKLRSILLILILFNFTSKNFAMSQEQLQNNFDEAVCLIDLEIEALQVFQRQDQDTIKLSIQAAKNTEQYIKEMKESGLITSEINPSLKDLKDAIAAATENLKRK